MGKIKEHFKTYERTYLVCGTGVIVAGLTVVIMKGSRTTLVAGVDCPTREPTGPFNFGRSIFGSVENNIVTTIHNGGKGNPGFVTRCVETGELFATQADAARAFNIPEEFISKHLNYGRELAEGIHFERMGVFAE